MCFDFGIILKIKKYIYFGLEGVEAYCRLHSHLYLFFTRGVTCAVVPSSVTGKKTKIGYKTHARWPRNGGVFRQLLAQLDEYMAQGISGAVVLSGPCDTHSAQC
jgi:hypothetical protein